MNTWIFQGNPKVFDIERYLANATRVRWVVRQHRRKIVAGDRVFFWVAGAGKKERAGIIAAGRIADSPAVGPDDPAAAPYWRTAPEGDALRVNVTVDSHVNEKSGIRRETLVKDPKFAGMSILKQPAGTNFLLAARHAARLEALWSSDAEPNSLSESVAVAAASQPQRQYGGRPGADPRELPAAKLHAKALAIEHYQAAGFEVEDTPVGHAFDLRCRKGPDEVRVKVEAAPGDGPLAIAIDEAINSAPSGAWRTDLFVAYGISLSEEADQLVATGVGGLVVEGLRPEKKGSVGLPPFQALIEIAVASWRFARLFSHVLAKLAEGEAVRYSSQSRYYSKRLEESLGSASIRLVNLEGQPYDVGMPVTVMNIDDFGQDDRDRLIVDQMVEPILMSPDGLLRAGSIMVRKAE